MQLLFKTLSESIKENVCRLTRTCSLFLDTVGLTLAPNSSAKDNNKDLGCPHNPLLFAKKMMNEVSEGNLFLVLPNYFICVSIIHEGLNICKLLVYVQMVHVKEFLAVFIFVNSATSSDKINGIIAIILKCRKKKLLLVIALLRATVLLCEISFVLPDKDDNSDYSNKRG